MRKNTPARKIPAKTRSVTVDTKKDGWKVTPAVFRFKESNGDYCISNNESVLMMVVWSGYAWNVWMFNSFLRAS